MARRKSKRRKSGLRKLNAGLRKWIMKRRALARRRRKSCR